MEINYKIDLNLEKSTITFSYFGNESLYWELINTPKSYVPLSWRIPKNGSKELHLNRDKNDKNSWDALLICEGPNLHYYRFTGDELVRYNPIESDHTLPYIILTGHSGGGTSIVAKSFRYLGAHLGDDVGDFENRKIHESHIFRSWAHRIINQEPLSLNGFDMVCSVFNPKPDKINVFKCPNLQKTGASIRLSNLLPNVKFVSVIKEKSNHTYSVEGIAFNQKHEIEIYQEQHPRVEGSPMFHLDFNKYFTDYQYANKVLSYIGLNVVLTQETFNDMLKAIKFETNRLTKK
jgi:hypothetical protein